MLTFLKMFITLTHLLHNFQNNYQKNNKFDYLCSAVKYETIALSDSKYFLSDIFPSETAVTQLMHCFTDSL